MRTHWEAREDLWDTLCDLMDAVSAINISSPSIDAAMERGRRALDIAALDQPPVKLRKGAGSGQTDSSGYPQHSGESDG